VFKLVEKPGIRMSDEWELRGGITYVRESFTSDFYVPCSGRDNRPNAYCMHPPASILPIELPPGSLRESVAVLKICAGH
jgi:hypothetical protein